MIWDRCARWTPGPQSRLCSGWVSLTPRGMYNSTPFELKAAASAANLPSEAGTVCPASRLTSSGYFTWAVAKSVKTTPCDSQFPVEVTVAPPGTRITCPPWANIRHWLEAIVPAMAGDPCMPHPAAKRMMLASRSLRSVRRQASSLVEGIGKRSYSSQAAWRYSVRARDSDGIISRSERELKAFYGARSARAGDDARLFSHIKVSPLTFRINPPSLPSEAGSGGSFQRHIPWAVL